MEKSAKSIVQSNFDRFKSYEGSDHIATRSSQINMLTLLESIKPREILEFGAGIGTLTALALENSEANITAVEKNKWCLEQFAVHNLPNNRIMLTQSMPMSNHYDFYIIDDAISINEVCKIFDGKKKSFIVFIEGKRSSTVAKLSFYSIFYKYSSVYIKFPSRLDLFEESSSEKGGSYFHFFKSPLMGVIFSYFRRFKKTKELQHFYYYIRNRIKNRKVANFCSLFF
jgi:hypothetical protein